MYSPAEINLALRLNGHPYARIAARLGVSPQAVSQAIRGSSPSRRTLLYAAMALTEPPASAAYPGAARELLTRAEAIGPAETPAQAKQILA